MKYWTAALIAGMFSVLSARSQDGGKVWTQNPPEERPRRDDTPQRNRPLAENAAREGQDAPRHPPPPMDREAWFKSVDTNGDGMISHDEFTNSALPPPPPTPEAVFKRADKNGDGVLSLEEFVRAPHPPPPPPPGLHGEPPPPPNLVDMFDRLDANADGVLNLDEFKRCQPPRPGPPRNGPRPPPPDGEGARPTPQEDAKQEF